VSRVHRALRYARACAFSFSGASRRARERLDGTRAALLMYHRVMPAAEAARLAVEPGMFVTPETFARQLDWLASASFHVLPLHEIVNRLATGQPLPRGACAITFDDGWRDNHDYALPSLERHAAPATIFVVTERVGTTGAFWPDEVCRRMAGLSPAEQHAVLERLGVTSRDESVPALLDHLKRSSESALEEQLDQLRSATHDPAAGLRELLDWSELDRIARGGVDVEAHGATHAILTRIAPDAAERELRAAREQLLARGHGRHGLLAYPSGGHDEKVRSIVRRAGYAAAVTTEPGLAHAGDDPFALPRLAVHDDVSRTRVEFLHRIPGSA
jgi:peptidoglycan/xylan/chitin deacetylase (PgdA/CDA1 family)